MKLNKIINESTSQEYNELVDSFLKYQADEISKRYFSVSSEGIIDCHHTLKNIDIHGADKITKDFIDENGVCKLKFGQIENGFSWRYDGNLKSLKNLPSTVNGMLHLAYLSNLNVFDLLIDHIDTLRIEHANVRDLSHVDKCDMVVVSNCYHIKSFDNLPRFDSQKITMLTVLQSTLDNKPTTNNDVYDLRLFYIDGITNCLYLPKKIRSLIISGCEDFDSYIGIDAYKSLQNFITDSKKHNNIITLLLTNTDGDKIHYHSVDKEIRLILNSYLFIPLSERSDHIMDCALELIDAGFEEAAEL